MVSFGKSTVAPADVQVPPGPIHAVAVPVVTTRTEDMIPCCGECIRAGVPVMPGPLAVVCCILNFFIPGVGSIVAGFSWCCCSSVEGLKCGERCSLCCKGYCYGFWQAAASAFVFGWIWSAVWGILFIVVSAKYYKKKEDRQIREEGVYVIPITQQPTPTYGQQPLPTYGQQPHPTYGQQPLPTYVQQPHRTYGQQPFPTYGQQPVYQTIPY